MDILQREVPLDKGFGPKGLLTRLTEHFPYSFSLYSLVFSFLMSNPFSSDLPSIYIFLLVGYEWFFSNNPRVGGTRLDYSWQSWDPFWEQELKY